MFGKGSGKRFKIDRTIIKVSKVLSTLNSTSHNHNNMIMKGGIENCLLVFNPMISDFHRAFFLEERGLSGQMIKISLFFLRVERA